MLFSPSPTTESLEQAISSPYPNPQSSPSPGITIPLPYIPLHIHKLEFNTILPHLQLVCRLVFTALVVVCCLNYENLTWILEKRNKVDRGIWFENQPSY